MLLHSQRYRPYTLPPSCWPPNLGLIAGSSTPALNPLLPGMQQMLPMTLTHSFLPVFLTLHLAPVLGPCYWNHCI